MKKSLLLLTTVLSFNVFSLSAAPSASLEDVEVVMLASASRDTEPYNEVSVASRTGTESFDEAASHVSRVVASADDLERIKAHIRGYGAKLGLPDKVVSVGNVGCSSWCSTTFKAAERFLLNEFAGQLLTRFLAIALDDLADGKLDGIAYGKKVSYAQEVGRLLGVDVSEEELKASAPVDESWAVRLIELSVDLTTIIVQSEGQKDKLIESAGAFAKDKMSKARKNLAVALIQETDRIIALELGNGKIDGLDAQGAVIDWQKEMKDSVERSLKRVLDGVM